ncbi:MAG: hypothetical protein LBT16_12975, partial [Treponema sp.]|nr:hypothetical protein [Treponema sp.]
MQKRIAEFTGNSGAVKRRILSVMTLSAASCGVSSLDRKFIVLPGYIPRFENTEALTAASSG